MSTDFGMISALDEKLNPVDFFLKPEEAVDDALVCVWQRVVPLVPSRDTELSYIDNGKQ